MNNHQKFTIHPLGNFLNPALALRGQGFDEYGYPEVYADIFEQAQNFKQHANL